MSEKETSLFTKNSRNNLLMTIDGDGVEQRQLQGEAVVQR